MSLDQAEAVFVQLAGAYEMPNGIKVQVMYNEASGLSLVVPGAPPFMLNLMRGLQFRTPQFSDMVIEFVMENSR
jgi:hypothetical protein